MSVMKFPSKSSDKLDRLTSPSKGNNKNCSPKNSIELYSKLSEILERLQKLLIGFKRDCVSSSPIS